VQLVEVTPELREHLGGRGSGGVLVSKVIAGTPAEEGGIEVGDLIVAVDGETVENAGDLQRAVARLDGEEVDVEIVRNGRASTLSITFPEADSVRPTGPRASVSWGTVARPPRPPRPAAVYSTAPTSTTPILAAPVPVAEAPASPEVYWVSPAPLTPEPPAAVVAPAPPRPLVVRPIREI
jgi:serine protease Do